MKKLKFLGVTVFLLFVTLFFLAFKSVEGDNEIIPDNIAIVSLENYNPATGARQVWAQVGGLIVKDGRPTVVTPAHALIHISRTVGVYIGKYFLSIPKDSVEILLERDLAYIPLPKNYPTASAFKIGSQETEIGELFIVGFVRSQDFFEDRAVYSSVRGAAIKMKFVRGQLTFQDRGTLCRLVKNVKLCAKYGAISGLYDSTGNIRFQDRQLFMKWLKEEPGILSDRMEAYKPDSEMPYVSGSLIVDEKGFLRSIIVRRTENCGKNCFLIGSLLSGK
ncbi:MAG: hypothetical protein HYY55_02365 [Candidatus Niyogibacteria bacterium]|nr:MAG: hypothetical protein HYY55_02365 [Candidatus Niyogibacteria bacterium]